ncbi:hypothetical protein HMN09_00270000 [Mycena chlorophos]|uniref:Clp1-like protein n=1 Tax=Mycena chlorophos TaxID=658473 RepID=A0A8H6TLK6_MYCCL|nr:hypothetical protein HMN09_00270000 [Mycena chlorophos]
MAGGLGSRRVSNFQNYGPSTGPASKLLGGSLGSRIRASHSVTSGHKRIRAAHTSKRLAKHKTAAKLKPKAKPTVDFNVTSVGVPPEMVDIEMGDATTSTSESVAAATPARSTKRYRLPRELRRPPFRETPKETLMKIDPELESTPVEYIKEWLEEAGPGMLKAAVGVTVDAPKDALPPTVTVQLNADPLSDHPPPTHMLAVHTSARTAVQAAGRRPVTLVPAHSMMLAVHCTNLPPFAVQNTTPQYLSPDSVLLPVQPLRIPHPQTFAPLMSFLYTQRAEPLLKSLLPNPPDLETDAASRAFAGQLAGTYTPQALLTHALRVHGLWQNTVALGIHVDELWDTIERAWEVLLTAIGFATGAEVDLLPEPIPEPESAPEPQSEATQVVP